jgi:predicted DNA-binding protein (MmcQ/YjbR family)
LTPAAFERAALALPGATCTIQWGDDKVYKVGGKMFAVTDLAATRVSMKVSDIAYEALQETGIARAAPYLARARWLQFPDLAALDEAEVTDWLATAHALVAAKLTRAARRELGIDPAGSR